MKTLSREKGFTLVEILIVVIIIGIITAIAIPKVADSRNTALTTTCKANRAILNDLSETYFMELHAYPSNQTDLQFNHYLKGAVVCPATKVDDYTTPGDGSWSCNNTGGKHN